MGNGQWQFSPAFDPNPFPDRDRELKTWLTKETGPSGSNNEALDAAAYFHLAADAALRVPGEGVQAVLTWREVASTPAIDMPAGGVAQ